jgi:glycogen phosphorylase
MQTYRANDTESIQKDIVSQAEYNLACTRFELSKDDAYRAASYAVRDRLIESFNDTCAYYSEQDVKRGYYLSAEYLMGRAFQNALVNLDLEEPFKDALMGLGFEMEELYSKEADPGLGNGGLGRLAACFLDSMATLSLPAWGYGIRYTYGIFKQHIVDGKQVERPDYWLANTYPWEIPRPDITYPVRFGGKVEEYEDEQGRWRQRWTGGDILQAMAYDNPIPGFDTFNTNNLRLWRSCPADEFDFDAFNESKYSEAIEQRRRAEDLSAVLYPNDDKWEGKVLRLKQQYFFVSASLQDLLREFMKKPGRKWSELPDKVAVQMNDTHPTLAVLEMMRLLIDVQALGWDEAWDLTKRTCNYTNHTVMPEALEKWHVEMLEELLPRHLQIVGEINRRFLEEVRKMYGDGEIVGHLSLFQEQPFKGLRMGNLAVLGSTRVNGVAAIHTEIVKKETFAEFYKYFCDKGQKDKFVNMTNGVTPRRWIHVANRPLSDIYTKHLGSQKWLTNMELCKELLKKKDDPALHQEWSAMKRQAKQHLAKWLKEYMNLEVDVDTLFDMQFKRIHEYKRQLLNALYIIHRYIQIKKASPEERKKFQKRTCLIGGKAAPAYLNAKTIIKLISNIGEVISKDPDVAPYLKVAFVPNYSVTVAEAICPASDISQHISTAGTEASGTSNMKFVMNGGLIIGTMDGANIEIREEGGHDTMFIFGCLEDEVPRIKEEAKKGNYPIDPRLQEVFAKIRSGAFSLGDSKVQEAFSGLVDKLCNTWAAGTWEGDRYLLLYDFPSYVDAQNKVDATYADQKKWVELSIRAAASMAKFSTDRTIREYADTIWGLKSAPRPGPSAPAKAPEVKPVAKVEAPAVKSEAPAVKSDTKAEAAPKSKK